MFESVTAITFQQCVFKNGKFVFKSSLKRLHQRIFLLHTKLLTLQDYFFYVVLPVFLRFNFWTFYMRVRQRYSQGFERHFLQASY